MENIIGTVLTSIVSGSVGGAFINFILKRKSKRFESNYERKLARYFHITTIMELYLYTEIAQYSISMTAWEVRSCSLEENKRRALNDLLVNKRQLCFITNDKKVHSTYEDFFEDPCDKTYQEVLLAMKKDLWEN